MSCPGVFVWQEINQKQEAMKWNQIWNCRWNIYANLIGKKKHCRMSASHSRKEFTDCWEKMVHRFIDNFA